jgi:hypothetical protein
MDATFRNFVNYLFEYGLVGMKTIKIFISSYGNNKCSQGTQFHEKSSLENKNTLRKLTNEKLKKTLLEYFIRIADGNSQNNSNLSMNKINSSNSSDNFLLNALCEDLVEKYNENIRLEKLKRLRNLMRIYKYHKINLVLSKSLNRFKQNSLMIRKNANFIMIPSRRSLNLGSQSERVNNISSPTSIDKSNYPETVTKHKQSRNKSLNQSNPLRSGSRSRERKKDCQVYLTKQEQDDLINCTFRPNTNRSLDVNMGNPGSRERSPNNEEIFFRLHYEHKFLKEKKEARRSLYEDLEIKKYANKRFKGNSFSNSMNNTFSSGVGFKTARSSSGRRDENNNKNNIFENFNKFLPGHGKTTNESRKNKNNLSGINNYSVDFLTRQENHVKIHQKKLEEMTKLDSERVLDSCTFKPKLNKSHGRSHSASANNFYLNKTSNQTDESKIDHFERLHKLGRNKQKLRNHSSTLGNDNFQYSNKTNNSFSFNSTHNNLSYIGERKDITWTGTTPATSRIVDLNHINSLYKQYKNKNSTIEKIQKRIEKEDGISFKPNIVEKNVKVRSTFRERNLSGKRKEKSQEKESDIPQNLNIKEEMIRVRSNLINQLYPSKKNIPIPTLGSESNFNLNLNQNCLPVTSVSGPVPVKIHVEKYNLPLSKCDKKKIEKNLFGVKKGQTRNHSNSNSNSNILYYSKDSSGRNLTLNIENNCELSPGQGISNGEKVFSKVNEFTPEYKMNLVKQAEPGQKSFSLNSSLHETEKNLNNQNEMTNQIQNSSQDINNSNSSSGNLNVYSNGNNHNQDVMDFNTFSKMRKFKSESLKNLLDNKYV